MKILITGGAGFIGTHLTRHLLRLGHEVTILDNFLPQVHSENRLATDVTEHVRLIIGDVFDPTAFKIALDGVHCVVHLAAETGTGQSMYEVARYERTNLAGTAILYDLLAKMPSHQVQRIVVASSRAIYGEGAYRCLRDGIVYPLPRSSAEKAVGHFNPLCPVCHGNCETIPTKESAPLRPSSFYGLTKQVQEQMTLLFGNVHDISSFALRYQNVYGPGQSLKNPYTGILAIFSNLVRVGADVNLFEDGKESRDFVYIDDVVQATVACVESNLSSSHAINVGSSERTTVTDVAAAINRYFGCKSNLKVSGSFREGDIRHGMADLTLAKDLLNYEPRYKFQEGLVRFLAWAEQSEPELSGYTRSLEEMRQQGLLHAH